MAFNEQKGGSAMQELSLFHSLESVELSRKQEQPTEEETRLRRINAFWIENGVRQTEAFSKSLLEAFHHDAQELISKGLWVGAATSVEAVFRDVIPESLRAKGELPSRGFCLIDRTLSSRRLYGLLDRAFDAQGSSLYPWKGWKSNSSTPEVFEERFSEKTNFFKVFDCYTGKQLFLKSIEMSEGDYFVDWNRRAIKIVKQLAKPLSLAQNRYAKQVKLILIPKAVVEGTPTQNQSVSWQISSYYPQGDLWDCSIESEELLSRSAKITLFAQLLFALAYLHQEGFVHGDVKLENCLVHNSKKRGLSLKLTDFSFIHPTGSSEPRVFGSVMYLAPETYDQATKIVPSRDCWAAGVSGSLLFFSMMPHVGDLLECLNRRKISTSPRENQSVVSSIAATICEDLANDPLYPVISGLLRENPEQRSSAQNAANALQSSVENLV